MYQNSNGNTVISNSSKRLTIVNGKEYSWRKEMKGHSSTQINGNVFIDGYELTKDGKWKRTLRALWYLLF